MRPGLLNAAISGLALSVAQLTKPLAIFLYPITGLFLIAGLFRSVEGRLRPRDVLVYAAFGFGLSIAVLNVVYSFDRSGTAFRAYVFESGLFRGFQDARWISSIPVPIPYPVLQGFDQMVQVEKTGSTFGNVYLLGEVRSVTDPAFHGFKKLLPGSMVLQGTNPTSNSFRMGARVYREKAPRVVFLQ